MPFSKSEMQEELFQFLLSFGKSATNLYGVDDSAWTERDVIQESPIWKAVSEMYDYGVMGIPSENLHPEGHISELCGDVERFLRAMDTPQMKLYLEEHNNTPPRLSILAVQSAVARVVLDGGWRETDYGAAEHSLFKGDMNHLTLAEVALLAQMDERSVRNAANPKLPDPLKTEQVGKRSLVRPEEARRWLPGRKSYIPTRPYTGVKPPSFDLLLDPNNPADSKFLDQIQRQAKQSGVSVEKLLRERLYAAAAATAADLLANRNEEKKK